MISIIPYDVIIESVISYDAMLYGISILHLFNVENDIHHNVYVDNIYRHKMLHQLIKIPRGHKVVVACSGGVDSMAVLDFAVRGGHDATAAYFNHSTPQANAMQDLVTTWCIKQNIPYVVGRLEAQRGKDESPEEFWRNERYRWLNSLGCDTIVTAHHLNDAAETWLFTSMHGQPKLILPRNGNVLRPFLLNEKQQFIDWCQQKNVPWFEDQSNQDNRYPRNRIRNTILPECLKVNPGFLKVIRKKYLETKT